MYKKAMRKEKWSSKGIQTIVQTFNISYEIISHKTRFHLQAYLKIAQCTQQHNYGMIFHRDTSALRLRPGVVKIVRAT